MKIQFITSSLYRMRYDWLCQLSNYADVDIFMLEDDPDSHREKWEVYRKNCRVKILSSHLIPAVGRISFKAARSIVNACEKEYDITVLDGYGYAMQLITMTFLNLKNKIYYVNVDGIVKKEKECYLIKRFKSIFLSKVPYYLCGSKAANNILQSYETNAEKIYNHPFTSLFEKDLYAAPATTEERETLRKDLHIVEDKIIISVGRFSYLGGYGKGYDVLLKAASNMGSEYGWYIVGGEPTEEFKRLTKEAGVKNFHYVKHIEKEELKKYYRASDLFVLMTVSDVWGLVINEAMACGLPVITTDKCVAGLELVENGVNGYIVPVGNDKELQNAINKVFENNADGHMNAASIERIKPYTIENMAKIHMEIFTENLKNEQNYH